MFSRYLRDLIWLNYCWELNQVSPVAKVALKIDVNLLNQPCKTAEWLTDWLTDLLRHLDSLDTRRLETLKALKKLERHLGTGDTRALEGHLDTQGTWALGP